MNKIPVHLGGGDNYMNLMIVTDEVHRLIHAVDTAVTAKYLEILNLDKRQIAEITKLRGLADREKINSCRFVGKLVLIFCSLCVIIIR